jgi:hypothetical protein
MRHGWRTPTIAPMSHFLRAIVISNVGVSEYNAPAPPGGVVHMRIGLAIVLAVLGLPAALAAQAPAPNTHPLYVELRNLAPAAEAVLVKDFVLQKDAATFTLSGALHLLPPVNGRVTGAVFIGQGTMKYEPPVAVERSMLRHLTKGEAFEETFERAVFRFTDDTGATIAAAGTAAAAASANDARNTLKDTNQALRMTLKDNVHARILHDVLNPSSGGLFHAYVTGRKYSNRMAYMIDPQGAGFVAPEEVQLVSWANNRDGIFAGHHLSDFYKTRQRVTATPGAWIDIQHQQLATVIDQSGELTGTAATTFTAVLDGLNAVPLSLFPTLRVISATDEGGAALAFVQEPKDEDADLWIVLPKPLGKGERFTVRTSYKGKEAVTAEGNDNFFPVARTNWYPNNVGIMIANNIFYGYSAGDAILPNGVLARPVLSPPDEPTRRRIEIRVRKSR